MDPFGNGPNRPNNNNNNNNNGNNRGSNNNQLSPFNPFGSMMLSPFEQHQRAMASHHQHNPFSIMNHMMSNMNGMFGGFDTNIIHGDPNAQVYSSSSVMSYSTADGKPKIYQESTQIQQGPGGVRETRKLVRDSEKGIEKMAVGHHIGDRAHIIERQKNIDGQIEEAVNYENLDEDEVNDFNREFEEKIVSVHRPSHRHSHHGNNNHHHHRGHLTGNIPLAIEDSSRHKNRSDRADRSDHKSKPRSSKHQ